jgi:hypothetical protein
MLGTASFIDLYSVVVKRPDPPVGLIAAGREITWTRPRLSREIMGWNVYSSNDGKAWKLATRTPIRETRFSAPEGGLYAVTAVEWSGIESLAVSGVAVVGGAKPVFMLDAEFATYSPPIKEVRDVSAANWFAVENTKDEAGSATVKFTSPAACRLSAFLRIRSGEWSVSAKGVKSGSVKEPDAGWKWVKLDAEVAVEAGENALTFESSSKGASLDKVILAPAGFAPQGPMYLDTTPPAAPAKVSARRLDRTLIEVTWAAPADDDVRHFNVYYSPSEKDVPAKQAFRIASPPGSETRYVDFAGRPGVAGYYAVTAVDRFGNESACARASVSAGE